MNEYLATLLLIIAFVWGAVKSLEKKFKNVEWVAVILAPAATVAAHAIELFGTPTVPIWKGYVAATIFGLIGGVAAIGMTDGNVLGWLTKKS